MVNPLVIRSALSLLSLVAAGAGYLRVRRRQRGHEQPRRDESGLAVTRVERLGGRTLVRVPLARGERSRRPGDEGPA